MEPKEQRPEKKIRIVYPEDICVCCGAPVPEGRQVCWACENGDKVKDRGTEDGR